MAPAAAARRAVSCAARAARTWGQSGAGTSRPGGAAGTGWPRSASLCAQAGPARAIRTARLASVSWVTVTVRNPGPVASAAAIHGSLTSRPARAAATSRGS